MVEALNAGNLERNRPIVLWADQWVLFDNAGEASHEVNIHCKKSS